MGSCPGGDMLSFWRVILVGSCPSRELSCLEFSWWGVVLVGNCPGGEFSWWRVVRVGVTWCGVVQWGRGVVRIRITIVLFHNSQICRKIIPCNACNTGSACNTCIKINSIHCIDIHSFFLVDASPDVIGGNRSLQMECEI